MSNVPENTPRTETAEQAVRVFPFSTLIQYRSQELVLGMSSYNQIAPYLPLVEEMLVKYGARVYEGTLSDMNELERDKKVARALPTRLIPIWFGEDVQGIMNKARRAARKGLSPSLAYRCIQSFLEPPDIDARLAITPEELQERARKLVEDTVIQHKAAKPDTHGHVNIDEFVVKQDEQGTVWEIPIDDIILAKPVKRPLTQGRSLFDYNHTPVIEVISGYYASGVPYCNWRLIARSQSYDPRLKEEADTTLLSIGMAIQADKLPPDLRTRDTRLGVNPLDSVFSLPLTQDVRTLPAGTQKEYNANKADANGRVAIPENREDPLHPQYYTFMGIDEKAVRILNSPVAFSERFGNEETPPNYGRAIAEAMRIFRKACRYIGLADAPATDRAFDILRGNTRLQGGMTLIEGLVHDMKQLQPGEVAWWQVDAIHEAITSCFFAPAEFIELGNHVGFEKYFPHWRYVQDILNQLPDRNHIRQQLFSSTEIDESHLPDGLHMLLTAIRQHNRNEQFPKNNWEMLVWLFTPNPQEVLSSNS